MKILDAARIQLDAALLPDAERAQRLAVVEEALTWIGTPYHHQGRIKGAGVDWGMLPAEVYAAVGVIEPIETPDYQPDFHLHRGEERYLGLVEAHAVRVEGRDPLPGDLALFRYGRVISHGAIVIAWPLVVHSYITAGGVVLDDAEANLDLRKRLVGAWSMWGRRGGAA